MKCFYTSNPFGEGCLNPNNEFVSNLKQCVPLNCNVCYICSSPTRFGKNDFYANEMKECMEASGFTFHQFQVLDDRNYHDVSHLIVQSQLIILAGGHVPTQNDFFQQINLKKHLECFDGTIVGISAGSMNCAELVYAHPEMKGEALDPNYHRFIKGLGLTKLMILPHYNELKDEVVDGFKAIEDIAIQDSIGRKFLALVDGSYVFSDEGNEKIYGEAYSIENGKIIKINEEGNSYEIISYE